MTRCGDCESPRCQRCTVVCARCQDLFCSDCIPQDRGFTKCFNCAVEGYSSAEEEEESGEEESGEEEESEEEGSGEEASSSDGAEEESGEDE